MDTAKELELMCDRVEENFTVLVSEEGDTYDIPSEVLGDYCGEAILPGAKLRCTIKGDTIIEAHLLGYPDNGNRERLKRLLDEE